jgi:thiol-disulfide isomerase/thioredoxin
MRAALLALALGLISAPLPAAAQDPLERLRALAPPISPTASDLYADEIAADRALLAEEAPLLFDPAHPGAGPEGAPVAIALFTGPGCEACPAARAELEEMAERLGLRVAVLDTALPANAALMDRLALDLLPSYAMPDRLIRGAMPAMVLERYLGE